MTKSMAVAFAPRITVNGLALGAVLPPADGEAGPDVIKNVRSGAGGQRGLREYINALLAGWTILRHRRDHPRGWTAGI